MTLFLSNKYFTSFQKFRKTAKPDLLKCLLLLSGIVKSPPPFEDIAGISFIHVNINKQTNSPENIYTILSRIKFWA